VDGARAERPGATSRQGCSRTSPTRGARWAKRRASGIRGGILIDLPHHAGAERVAATQQALDAGAPAIFEGTFIADGTFVAIDVLVERLESLC